MDWDHMINRNRTALLRIAATLFAMLGVETWVTGLRIAPKVRSTVARLLKPAESAARRLIFVVARDMKAEALPPPRARAKSGPVRNCGRRPRLAFRLFDAPFSLPRARVRTCKNPPHIWSVATDPYAAVRTILYPAPPPAPCAPIDESVEAANLARRLSALKSALENLPREARRLVRIRARRQAAKRLDLLPMRPGRPPGHRAKPRHEVDEVLDTCHWLAREVEKAVPS